MKKLLLRGFAIMLAAAFTVSCEDSIEPDPYISDDTPVGELSHEMIELGEQLQDPYSVENITKALSSLYPTKASRIEIKPTDVYARFLPQNEEQMDRLLEMGVEILDHPMDFAIVKEGDYYRDPEIGDDGITWQYCVLPNGFKFPSGIRYEILDYCYISENDPATRSLDDGIDWDAVEEEAFRLTGNSNLYEPQTKGKWVAPSGRITIVDDSYNGGKPFGLAGVKVVCNSFVKFATAYTDRDGYYTMSHHFSSRPRYRILFKNKAGFKIGFNLILVPASVSTLGKGPKEGLDYVIDKNSDRKLFCRSVINNAAYEYIGLCGELGITPPPSSLRIWLLRGLSASSTPMLKHGAIIDNSIIGKYLGSFAPLVKHFLPDITIGTKGDESYADIYEETVHEMAHASHFAKVGIGFWDNYVKYVIESFIFRGRESYGDGSGDKAGYCEVGEMWGYFMQNKLYNLRYGGAMPVAGANYWFHPQIFSYLDERGIGPGKIFAALDGTVTDAESLRNRLLGLYPESEDIINQVFERYAK